MKILSSRLLITPSDPVRSRRFYRDQLGLAVFREFGDPDDPGLVFHLGNGLLELSGRRPAPDRAVPASDSAPLEPDGSGGADPDVDRGCQSLWLQVRDIAAEYSRLDEIDVPILRRPRREPWGLLEMWISDPDDIRIVLVEVPDGHPLKRDYR